MQLEFDVDVPFTLPIHAGKDDIDELNHINNEVYLKWMMLAARAHSDSYGYTIDKYKEIGAIFVVGRHEINYLSEGLQDDRLQVATWCGEIGPASVHRHFQILRERDGKTLVRAVTKWIFVDFKTGRPRRIPPEVKELVVRASRVLKAPRS